MGRKITSGFNCIYMTPFINSVYSQPGTSCLLRAPFLVLGLALSAQTRCCSCPG